MKRNRLSPALNPLYNPDALFPLAYRICIDIAAADPDLSSERKNGMNGGI